MPTPSPARGSAFDQLEGQSVLIIECSIPPHMTIDEWRRRRVRRPSVRRAVTAALTGGSRRL
jgi:hypothetical protein